jgi:hypothetical protein
MSASFFIYPGAFSSKPKILASLLPVKPMASIHLKNTLGRLVATVGIQKAAPPLLLYLFNNCKNLYRDRQKIIFHAP